MNSHSLTGIFQPDELRTLKAIFDEITSQDWFSETDEAREGFARYLLNTFPGGTFNETRHRAIVELSARMFYADDGRMSDVAPSVNG